MIDKRLYPAAALHGRVAHEIGRRIVSGEIAAGDLLPRETELAASFNISRQAIREALKVLSAKGLVVARRRAGTRVTARDSWNLLDPDVIAWHPEGKLDAAFLSDLVELRQLIEPAAAELAARRGDPDRLAGIAAALERMRAALTDDDPEAYGAADREFHSAIFGASGNVLVEHMGSILGPLYERSFRVQRRAGGQFGEGLHIHAAARDAIFAGDPERARRAMDDILSHASDQIAMAAVRK